MYSFHSFRHFQNLQFNFPNFWFSFKNIMSDNKKSLDTISSDLHIQNNKSTLQLSEKDTIKLLNRKIKSLEDQLGAASIEIKILTGNLEKASEELKLLGKTGFLSNYSCELINVPNYCCQGFDENADVTAFKKSKYANHSSKITSSAANIENHQNKVNETNSILQKQLADEKSSQKMTSDKITNTDNNANNNNDMITAIIDENNILKERVAALVSRLKVVVRSYELLKNNSNIQSSSSSSVLNLVVRANDDIMEKSSSDLQYENKEMHQHKIVSVHRSKDKRIPESFENLSEKKSKITNRKNVTERNNGNSVEISSGNTKYFVKSLEFKENLMSSDVGMKSRILKFENQQSCDDSGLVQKIRSKFEK